MGDIALLARNANGVWNLRDECELDRELSRAYGFPVDVRRKRAGLATVANALQDRNLAKAQIAALLLQLPDPPLAKGDALAKMGRVSLCCELAACGLLKAEDG